MKFRVFVLPFLLPLWTGLGADPLPTGLPTYHELSFPEISLPDIRVYVEKKRGMLLDAREERAYRSEHIPGALPLPAAPAAAFDHFYAQMKLKLEADKTQPIVVYCTNRSCPLAPFLYNKLTALGFTQVLVFHEGFYAWQQAGLPVEKDSAP